MNNEILNQLALPFPKDCHKARKLPGGGYHIYVPWENYVDLLNRLLKLSWSISYCDPVVAGDYLVIRAQLTITLETGTISREGNGTARTFPPLNDEGKEKIIGDPINNAARDALKDACYQFGIGRYLDNQGVTCNLLGVKDAEEFWHHNKPKQKGEISREEWRQRKASQSTPPKPKSVI